MNGLAVILSDEQLNDLAGRIAARISLPEPPSTSGLVTINEVCERLGISRTTVYQMRKRGDLKAVNIGGAVRFRKEDVDALIDT